MSEIITFVPMPSGRIEAHFGRHVVGIIEPWSPERVGQRGNGCHYQVKLSELQPAQEARSIQWARTQLLYRIADWFDGGAGQAFAIARRIRDQAERERAAA